MVVYVDWREIHLKMSTVASEEIALKQNCDGAFRLGRLVLLNCQLASELNICPPLLTSAATLALRIGASLGYRFDICQMCGDHGAPPPLQTAQ